MILKESGLFLKELLLVGEGENLMVEEIMLQEKRKREKKRKKKKGGRISGRYESQAKNRMRDKREVIKSNQMK